MKKIYLDTNFLLIPSQFRVDIYSEIKKIMEEPYQLYVLDRTLYELEILKERGGKVAQETKLALALLKKQKDLNITPFSKELGVDDALVELIDKNTIIATQDAELKRNAQKKGAKIITLRQKRYLIII